MTSSAIVTTTCSCMAIWTLMRIPWIFAETLAPSFHVNALLLFHIHLLHELACDLLHLPSAACIAHHLHLRSVSFIARLHRQIDVVFSSANLQPAIVLHRLTTPVLFVHHRQLAGQALPEQWNRFHYPSASHRDHNDPASHRRCLATATSTRASCCTRRQTTRTVTTTKRRYRRVVQSTSSKVSRRSANGAARSYSRSTAACASKANSRTRLTSGECRVAKVPSACAKSDSGAPRSNAIAAWCGGMRTRVPLISFRINKSAHLSIDIFD